MLPLEEPVSDVSTAAQELKQRPLNDLQRARQHHRRALKSLRNGAYDALSEDTRLRLIKRFRTNLKALNEALEMSTDRKNTSC
jgi:ribosome-binding ATPase YchF (GTP1/OBG family)